ncbi:MAG: hypothetical protein H8E35_08100 [Ardenticatenia bacterium]|nr:hypothetical protein [Ardenticatenia bacterium]
MIGLDVKAGRTQPAEIAAKHLSHSMPVFLRLLALSRSSNREPVGELIAARDYDQLDWLIVSHLTGGE